MPVYNKSRGCWSDHRFNMKFSDFITSDEELDDEYDSDPGYYLTDSEAEESEEEDEIIQINSHHYQRVRALADQLQNNAAATLIQKHWRGRETRRFYLSC